MEGGPGRLAGPFSLGSTARAACCAFHASRLASSSLRPGIKALTSSRISSARMGNAEIPVTALLQILYVSWRSMKMLVPMWSAERSSVQGLGIMYTTTATHSRTEPSRPHKDTALPPRMHSRDTAMAWHLRPKPLSGHAHKTRDTNVRTLST